MDDLSKAKLDEILKKEVAALTEGDKQFLRAREAYLTADQKEAYAEIFEAPKEPEAEKESEEAPKEKKKK